MAALVAVMIIVSVGTFDWHSIAPATLKRMPAGEIVVMLVTVIATLASHNLAIGVVLGVLTAMVVFARRVAHFAAVTSVLDPEGTTRIYYVHGELFFASSNDLVYQFNYTNDPEHVVIDLTAAHIWDASSVAALDAITTKYETRGKTVDIVGLNDASASFHENLAGKLRAGH
jgi:SulP family sulfate permease